MSGAPKRSHEEGGGHSSSASKYPHEDTGTYPKMPSSLVPTEYHLPAPYEMGQDTRMPRIPRTEPRDSDRSPLQHSVYRMASSTVSNDSHMDSHQDGSKSRMESRDAKENREVRVESRESRVEQREYQSGKGEKDGMFESRGDESKELKYDRENYRDSKGDVEVEKDLYGGASIHSSWKDSRDYHRGKSYSEPPGGNIDHWSIQRSNSQGPVELGKEGSATEERDYAEAHEAVGENKSDSKGEDRFKDKDRKRKDGKLRDWGDRDKERGDHRSSVQVGNSSVEVKESGRKEREAERWERERKDLKEKERPKEREKDRIKRESLNGVEKEGLNNEKDLGDGSVRIQEQENQASEQKKQKELVAGKMLIVKLEIGEEKEMVTQKETDLKSATGAMTKNLMMDVQMVKGLKKEKGKFLIMESSSVKGCLSQEAALKWQTASLVLSPDLRTMKDLRVNLKCLLLFTKLVNACKS